MLHGIATTINRTFGSFKEAEEHEYFTSFCKEYRVYKAEIFSHLYKEKFADLDDGGNISALEQFLDASPEM